MKVLKVIELLGKSDKSWDDAAQKIMNEASKSVNNIHSLYSMKGRLLFQTIR